MPDVLAVLPSETDVEIKASEHKNIFYCIILHYIFIFLSKFEATTKAAWRARWVLCHRTYRTRRKSDSREMKEAGEGSRHWCWRAMPYHRKTRAVRSRSIGSHCSSSDCRCELCRSCTTEEEEGVRLRRFRLISYTTEAHRHADTCLKKKKTYTLIHIHYLNG